MGKDNHFASVGLKPDGKADLPRGDFVKLLSVKDEHDGLLEVERKLGRRKD